MPIFGRRLGILLQNLLSRESSMNIVFHKDVAQGRWFTLSLAEQMGNIGSEVARAAHWQDKDEKLFQGCVERALELFDLNLADARWKGRLREIARAREVFCDAVHGGKEYGSTLHDLQGYFLPFAIEARRNL